MKSKFLIFCILFFSKVSALENLDIKSREISIDKKNEITIFKNEVVIKDEMNNIIKSDYVLYNNKLKRLDIKGNELVKGINLDGLRVLGKPQYFAKKYYLDGADEIFFQDVVASLYDSNSLHSLISRIAKNIFIAKI